LTFLSDHEIFIRRSWYSVLLSPDATISCRIKKAVVGMTQLITALIKKGSVEKLTEFLNSLDATRSIKFTYEVEQDGKLPFLDILLERT